MWKKKKNNRKLAFNTETVLMAAKAPLNSVLTYFQTTSLGLTDEEVEKRLSLYGKNEIVHEQKKKPLVMLAKAFINPFVGVLTALVAISYVMDVWMADPGDQDWTSIIVVSTMIILSTILRFVQEWKANRSSEALQKMVTNTCYVMRLGTSTRDISGVSPTATEMAKMKASNQSPFVIPLTRNTIGTIMSMKRMSSRLTLVIPLSKAVAARWPATFLAMVPR